MEIVFNSENLNNGYANASISISLFLHGCAVFISSVHVCIHHN
jgi:hypothetical protein